MALLHSVAPRSFWQPSNHGLPFKLLPIAALSFALAALTACGSAPPKRSNTPPPRTAVAPSPPQCNTVPAQFAIGQSVNAALLEKARAAAQADFARAIRPEQVITQEFRAGRLNLHLDASGRVIRISCG